MESSRLVFVCSGNICRSPMGVEIARLLYREKGLPTPLISSMGTLNLVGHGAHRYAVLAIEEVGGDLSTHRSQGLNPTVLTHADAVFCMEQRHVDAVTDLVPSAMKHTLLLSNYAEVHMDGIWDPVSGTLEDFQDCRDLITLCLDHWLSGGA